MEIERGGRGKEDREWKNGDKGRERKRGGEMMKKGREREWKRERGTNEERKGKG